MEEERKRYKLRERKREFRQCETITNYCLPGGERKKEKKEIEREIENE